ncbi:flavoprotein oxygenase [Rhypophila decipiens]
MLRQSTRTRLFGRRRAPLVPPIQAIVMARRGLSEPPLSPPVVYHHHNPSLIQTSPIHSTRKQQLSPLNPTAKMSSQQQKTQAELTGEFEKEIKRNPHGNFKQVEATRPPWQPASPRHTQTAQPTWTFGAGANNLPSPSPLPKSISIDPYADGRSPGLNYKLLISAITPRPIALLSTRSPDGKVQNLAPFSYFNVISHDPPLFIIGFVGAASNPSCKDSLRNMLESKECVINIISEGIIEAANSTSINAPYGVSEWDVSGLTPVYDCETVSNLPRVKEAVFSIEGKLESSREFESRAVPGRMGTTLVVIEGTRFWAREDALDAEGGLLKTDVLRPMGRMGGITYSRQIETIELPRPDFERDLGGHEGLAKIKEKRAKENGGEVLN